MAGERGGKILPLLLTQRARNKAEERELARRLGIRGFGDMTSLLAAVSRPLVEMLRWGLGGAECGQGEDKAYVKSLKLVWRGWSVSVEVVAHLRRLVRVCAEDAANLSKRTAVSSRYSGWEQGRHVLQSSMAGGRPSGHQSGTHCAAVHDCT